MSSGRGRKAISASLRRSSWLVRWAVGAPSRWLGRKSSVGQDLAGGADGLSYLRNLARGNRIRREANFEQLSSAQVPLLLIHGFLGTRGSMFPLERRLQSEGFIVVSFNIGALNVRDIRRSAFMIHRKIDRILSETPATKIDILAHSMGGLIGLYYVKKLGGAARVRRLVMMGTPVHGTWAALLGIATLGLWSTSSWQLLPRSRFLDELHQGQMPQGVEIHTIAAARDWVVPLATTRLTGANAMTVPLGHSSLVVSEEVFQRVIAVLREPAADDGADGDGGDEREGNPDHEG